MDWPAFLTTRILPVALSVLAGFMLAVQCTKTDYVAPQVVDELLDENTRVLTAQIRDLQDLKDEIEAYSQSQADRIESQNEQIVALTQVAGQLRIYRDSVKTLRGQIQVVRSDTSGTLFSPVSMTHTQSFSNGLFVVDCQLAISETGCISMQADLRQQRDIVIAHTLTMQSPGIYNAYIYLPDFDRELTQEIVTQPPPPPQSWWDREGKKALRYGILAVAGFKLIEIIAN